MTVVLEQQTDEIAQAWGLSADQTFLEDVPMTMCIVSSVWPTIPESEHRLHLLFQDLSGEWKDATAGLPRVRDKINHESYSRIIAWGMEAVPYLLTDLANSDEPSHWFEALHKITGADPVPEGDRGDLNKMAEAWIQWGRSRTMVS